VSCDLNDLLVTVDRSTSPRFERASFSQWNHRMLYQIKYVFNIYNFCAGWGKPIPPATAKAIRTNERRRQRVQNERYRPRTEHDYARMEAAIEKIHRKNLKRFYDRHNCENK
jgi:hypothetical protein